MFLLGTAQMILSLFTTGISIRMSQALVQQNPSSLESSPPLPHLWQLYFALDVAQNIVFLINNCLTDVVFLYRCYIIWGSRWKLVVVPALCIVCTVVLGFVATVSYDSLTHVHYIDRRIPFIMGVVTNVILVGLTAGRIWWISRELEGQIGRRPRVPFHTVILMLLESGSIYCLCMILQVIAQSLATSNAANIFLGVSTGLGQQVVNIAPALIIVRVGSGEPVQDTGIVASRLVFQSTPLNIPEFTHTTDSVKPTTLEMLERPPGVRGE